MFDSLKIGYRYQVIGIGPSMSYLWLLRVSRLRAADGLALRDPHVPT
jgi:hypothetical protein